MSLPQDIKGRKRSIAFLKRSPLNSRHNSPRAHSFLNLLVENAPFLSKDKDKDKNDSGASSSLGVEENRPVSMSPESPDNFASGINDPKLLQLVARHLKDSPGETDKLLAVEGADITRDLYKLQSDKVGKKPHRSRSFSLIQSSSRKGSFASSLNVPGGFRRQFLLAKDHNKTPPSLITRNFVEFLSIYGHFAGESLEDDDDYIACHYSPYRPYGEDTPLLPDDVNPNGTASDRKAYFLLLKAFVGTGVLFLPKAFSSGGLFFSTATLFAFGLLSFWCYHILVKAKVAMKVSSFGDIGLKTYGPWLQLLILTSIILSQVGFVAAYIVFTAENLRAFVVNVTSYRTQDLSIFWFILLQALVLAPLSLVRDITKLSLLALLANTFIFLGLVTILYYTLKEFAGNSFIPGNGIHYWFNQSESSLFIGVAIFAFEGIGLIIPIQESMIYPHHFSKILFYVIATISTIFVFIGAAGYLTFGSDINTVILLNLPQRSPTVIMTQLLYACAILLSTPIQIFPAVRLIELKIFSLKSGKNSLSVKWQKNIVRIAFVLGTATVSLYGGHNLDKFVSFVGCFGCIPLVYMYPPMLHLRSCCVVECEDCLDFLPDPDATKKRWLARLNYALLTIGAVALVYTTYDILSH